MPQLKIKLKAVLQALTRKIKWEIIYSNTLELMKKRG
jgi:hypothetical protein